MKKLVAFGLALIFLGSFGLLYSFGIISGVHQGAVAALGLYPVSVKTPEEKIGPFLKEKIEKAEKGEKIPVVVSLTAEPGGLAVAQQMNVIPQLTATGLQITGRTTLASNTVFGTISAERVKELASNSYVSEVLYDGMFFRLSSDAGIAANVGQIGAPNAWAKGYKGQGVVVIVIDSGIQNNHPWLMRGGKSLVLKEYHVCSNADYTHWHGTHVAGIVASQDSTYKGVAPGIKGFIDIVTFNSNGQATLSWVLKALDIAYTEAENFKDQGVPVVSTNSWGGPSADNPVINKVRYAAMKLADLIPVVFAAGNYRPSSGTITSPGDADKENNEIITVGAVDSSNNIACFSSRGPDSWGNEHNEPDVVAPGVNVISSVPGGHRPASGTSMATPHVAGTVALMLSKNSNIGNMQSLEILESTAKDLGAGGFDYAYGYGIIQAGKAVDAVPGPSPIPIPNAIQALSIIGIALGSVLVLREERKIPVGG